ncbi:hypothetical protein ACHAP8_012452 [Fusarium lateritium]
MPLPSGKDKRRARFAAAQATLTEDQLQVQRQQNIEAVQKPLAHITLQVHKLAKAWFIEFMEDQHPDINAETQYFTISSPEPDCVLLKEYARYIARSRVGRISTTLKVNTVVGHISSLLSVLDRDANRAYNPSIRREMGYFITNNLAQQEGLSTASLPKLQANSEDVSFIVHKLYDGEYLGTFGCMRTVLNLTLYMMLIIDTCGRGGEFTNNTVRPEYMCLRWEDVTFFTFQSADNDDFDIRVNLKIRWQKNETLDDSKYKIVPLVKLLPTSMALEDTLRLLINIALLPPDLAKTGRRIQLDQGILQVPVLRRMAKHRVTIEAVQSVDLPPQITRLGQYCGIETNFTGYCLRRGVAYVLAMSVSDDMRCFLMGHHLRNTYAKHYQSKTSTIDFPSMFRGLDQASPLPQGSILLNRSANAPLSLSPEGVKRVMEHEDVQRETTNLESIRQYILQTYPSVVNAREQNDPLAQQFDDIHALRRSHIDFHTKRLYKEEYQAHFTGLSTEQDSVSAYRSADILDPSAYVQSSSQPHIGDDYKQTPRKNAVQTATESSIQKRISGQSWLQSLDESNSSSSRQVFGRGTSRISGKGVSAYNDMKAELESLHDDPEAHSACMVKWFGITHPIDQFPPGQEPISGTYTCRFCNKDLNQFHHDWEHTQSCSKKDAIQRALELRQELSPLDRPCQYQFCGHGDQFHQFVSCNKTFNTMKEEGEHMRSHVRTMRKKDSTGQWVLSCFFQGCASHPEGGRINRDGPEFKDEGEQLAHVWTTHRVATTKTPEVTFCAFCQMWLIEPSEWQLHAEQHLEDAQIVISTVGCTGISAGRAIVPRLCPFCINNESLPAYKRIFTCDTVWSL